MPMNQQLAAKIADDITFAFHADETGDCVTNVRLQIIKSTGEGYTKADEETLFEIRVEHGNPDRIFGSAYQISETAPEDEDIAYLMHEENGAFHRHLFTATDQGFDFGYKDNPDVDGNRELDDLSGFSPGKNYAQELSEDLDGFVLYFAHELCERGRGDRVFDYVTAYVFSGGEEAASYSAEVW